MSGRGTALALAMAIGAVPAFADNARPRGGGSSGGGSSAGAQHHSGGSGSSSSGYRSGGGPSHSGGASHTPSGAEYRHPRAGTGTGSHYYGYGYRHGYPYYGYRPYYYGYGPYGGYYGYDYYPYYGGYYGYGYGYTPGYGYSSGGYGYSSGGYGDSGDSGAVRTFVEPSETKIFLDGRYAGTADDFDGMFQRLYAAPGAHELMLRIEGYKTHRVKLYLSPGGTLKLHHDMVKGSGEDAQIDTLGNPADERWGKRDRRWDDDDQYGDEVRGEDRRRDDADDAADQEVRQDRPPVEGQPRGGFSVGRDDAGTVRLAIQPGDASVYVDGQFRGAAERVRSLGLSAGKHRIEVVRPGFRTIEREVDVRDGEETTLEVELSRS